MKLKAASQFFTIPATSLRDRLYGKTRTTQRGNLPTSKVDKEKKLLDYIFNMQDFEHPLIPTELCLKLALAIQTKETPWSVIGVPNKSSLRRFRLRHPEIATRKSQGLEATRTHALYPTIAKTLYTNLEELYMTFHYPPSHI